MQTLMRKSVCALLSLLLLLSAVLPVKAAAETAPVKVVRVGSFEDTFNYCNEKGARKGYGYELLETLSGYTGWQPIQQFVFESDSSVFIDTNDNRQHIFMFDYMG